MGINSAYHESAACLIKDGKIVAAAEEERFNRVKHAKKARVDNPDELPISAINYCLKKAGIELKDVDHIGFSLNPRKRLKNIGKDKHFIKGEWGTKEGEKLFYRKVKTVPEKLSKLAGENIKKKFHWIDHHLCHAASCFFVSPYKESVIIVIDGIGEFATIWIGYGKDNKIYKIKEIFYPNSLGFLWEKLSEFLGFTKYDAGKVMGLSSYGNYKVFYDQFHKIVNFDDKNIFTIDNNVMRFRNNDFSQIEKLFNVKRRLKNDPIEKGHEDIAATLQKISEKVILRLCGFAKDKFHFRNLCLSGGVILNCVANESTFLALPFEDVFIPSGPHDAGTSIGAAYYIWNQTLNEKRGFVYKHAFWGPAYSEKDIKDVLKDYNLSYRKVSNIEREVAKLLARGKIVSWFQGRMEFGPRALGNRSILADPRRKEMVDLINHKVKLREWFRPFAPSVTEDEMDKFFYIKKVFISDRFMLFTVSPRYPEKIPAVTHVDETCRVQAIDRYTNPKYHRLLEEFESITGIPIVLNTSYNVQEPIVCSPEDAVKTFLKTNIDYLAVEDFLVKKKSKKSAWSGISEVNLHGRESKRLMVVLIAKGCEWAMKRGGPCRMCNYWIQHDKNISSKDIIKQFKHEVKKHDFKKDKIEQIDIYNSGSFLNDNEFPEEARVEIMKIVRTIPSIKKILIESRPEYIDERKIKRLREILGKRDLEIGIGLESSNDVVRERFINKGFSLKDFERAVKIIKRVKAKLRVYVIVKPAHLTEKDAIEDAVKTTRYVFKLGERLNVDTEVHLEPLFIKAPSLVFSLWKMGKYKRVWLWSVIEILKQVSKFGKIHVGLDIEGMLGHDKPGNCRGCTPKVVNAIRKFNKNQNLIVFRDLKCDCVKEWKKSLREKSVPFKERVK